MAIRCNSWKHFNTKGKINVLIIIFLQLVVDNQEELLEQPLVEEIIKESLADQVEEPVVASIDKEAVFEPFVAADKGILTVSNKKLFYFSWRLFPKLI